MAVPMLPSRRRNITFIETLIAKATGAPGPYIRKIDLVEGRREVPMKVLCLGYCRTGTFSLFTALTMLGYTPYHMAEAVKNAAVDLECWAEGVEETILKNGKPWGRKEFDKLTGNYDASFQARL